MSVTKDDVRKVARLSRIAVTEDHLDELVGELNGILGWMGRRQRIDFTMAASWFAQRQNCATVSR